MPTLCTFSTQLHAVQYTPVITYVYYLFTYVLSKYFADRGTLLTVSALKASKGSRFQLRSSPAGTMSAWRRQDVHACVPGARRK
jgi:hypothetical protein